MSYGDLIHSEGQPGGKIRAWATWSRLRGFATCRGTFSGWTSEKGVWVRARRLVMVLFAMIWLPTGVYVSFAYMGVRYVPPVFFDELEGSGRDAAAQAEMTLNGRMPDSSVEFEWQRVPGVIEDVITLNAPCPALTIVSQASPDESAMPILERLAVVPNENRDEHGAIPCPDIARHAARRGVRAEAARTMSNGIDVSDVLLSQVSYAESDLLAMSAHGYTHAQDN